jgi:hypothetical protein
MTFSDKGACNSHQRTHTGEERAACTVCQVVFSKKQKLKPFNCGQCGARINQRSQLTVHLRVHTGERPYSCKICTRSFSHSTALKLHLWMHTGEEAHVCELCKKSFAQLPHLKKHMLYVRHYRFDHGGNRPLAAPIAAGRQPGPATRGPADLLSNLGRANRKSLSAWQLTAGDAASQYVQETRHKLLSSLQRTMTFRGREIITLRGRQEKRIFMIKILDKDKPLGRLLTHVVHQEMDCGRGKAIYHDCLLRHGFHYREANKEAAAQVSRIKPQSLHELAWSPDRALMKQVKILAEKTRRILTMWGAYYIRMLIAWEVINSKELRNQRAIIQLGDEVVSLDGITKHHRSARSAVGRVTDVSKTNVDPPTRHRKHLVLLARCADNQTKPGPEKISPLDPILHSCEGFLNHQNEYANFITKRIIRDEESKGAGEDPILEQGAESALPLLPPGFGEEQIDAHKPAVEPNRERRAGGLTRLEFKLKVKTPAGNMEDQP